VSWCSVSQSCKHVVYLKVVFNLNQSVRPSVYHCLLLSYSLTLFDLCSHPSSLPPFLPPFLPPSHSLSIATRGQRKYLQKSFQTIPKQNHLLNIGVLLTGE
jgi:hypothetical protein